MGVAVAAAAGAGIEINMCVKGLYNRKKVEYGVIREREREIERGGGGREKMRNRMK